MKYFEYKCTMFYVLTITFFVSRLMADQNNDEQPTITRKITNSSCFPCTPGSENLVVQSALALGSYSIVQTVLTTPGAGVFTLQSGTKFAMVEAVGAGGGSGGCPGSASSEDSAGAGSGSYSRRVLTSAQIGATVAYTVARGGTAGIASSAGSTGGTTSFGTLVTAPGGIGSAVGARGIITGGAGGALGTGDLTIAGALGGSSITGVLGRFCSGVGADSPGGFGQGGYPTLTLNGVAVNGQSGQGYGSGAGGTASGNTGVASTGGTGAGGIIIITEYLFQ